MHSFAAGPKSDSVIMCVYAMQWKGTGDDNPGPGLMFKHGVQERKK
jgi:hypothetical protein